MYRIYDLDNNEYLDNNYVVDNTGSIILLRLNNKGIYKFSEQEDYIVERATGLKDKNGIEIYEGDVMTCEDYPFRDFDKNDKPILTSHNYVGVVEVDGGGSWLVLKVMNTLKRGISHNIGEPLNDRVQKHKTLEVIGTIHDTEFKHLVGDE